MKIYLAGSYLRRIEFAAYSALLEEDGHHITAAWLSGVHEKPPWTEATYTRHDLDCIREADVYLGFTEPNGVPSEYKRGGRHVEFGYAVAHRKKLVIVGPRENAFYHLPGVYQFDTFPQAREHLKSGRA